MSGGGKSKMSKITRRFKDNFKRFFKIDDNNKIKKCESWGSLNGIFKFLKADKETYKVVERDEDGATVARQVSGIEKMKENIKAAPATSSNKDRYIKAIECFENGGDTILSGTVCVPYADFVNSGGAPAPATGDNNESIPFDPFADAPTAPPATVEEEGEAGKAGEAGEGQGEKVEADATATAVKEEGESEDEGQGQGVTATEEEGVTATEEEGVTAVKNDNNAAALNTTAVDADAVQSENVAGEVKGEEGQGEGDAAPATAADADENIDAAAAADALTHAAAAALSTAVNKVEEGGGRSRRHTKPSRRVKSRKSKKGRMTRRKHRSSGRR